MSVEMNTFPPYVVTPAQQDRWAKAEQIATAVAAEFSSPDPPDSAFVWRATRQLYHSDIPTGPDGPLEEGVEDEAGRVEVDPEPHRPNFDRAIALLAQIGDEDPGPKATAEQLWQHIALMLDLLEEVLGPPEQWDFAEHEQVDAAKDARALLPKALRPQEGLDEVAWTENLHPRTRLGKWTQKLGALRDAAHEHHAEASKRVRRVSYATDAKAALVLRREVRRAHKPGGALYADPAGLRNFGVEDEALEIKFRRHAAQERNREGISGMRQKAIRARTVAAGTALTALAVAYSHETAPRVSAAAGVHDKTDVVALYDATERARAIHDSLREIVQYVVEHREELAAVASAVGHAARALVTAAVEPDVDDPDLALAELVLDASPGDDEDQT